MTKDPNSEGLMLVMEYAQRDNLRSFLENAKPSELSWEAKTYLLWDIIRGLKVIHKVGYVHKDLHSKNILCFERAGTLTAKITDLGLSSQPGTFKPQGIIPFMAPEYLNSCLYTTSSDIYSFGIIMAELSIENPFFWDHEYNIALILKISNGLRPELASSTPQPYVNLCKLCTDADPEKRPTAQEIYETLTNWLSDKSTFKIKDKI